METIQIGKVYRHFKGGLYQVLCTAVHTETDEKLVIYQALYGNFGVFARPVDRFTEEVTDSPENTTGQKYRFEEVKNVDNSSQDVVLHEDNENASETPSPVIMQFLDASSPKEKLDIIKNNYQKIDERTITNMEVSLDIVSSSENLDQRISYVCDVLSTRSRFEDTRLR